jgi:hypothetical protein
MTGWKRANETCGQVPRPRAAAAIITFWTNRPRSSQLWGARRLSMAKIRPTGAPKNTEVALRSGGCALSMSATSDAERLVVDRTEIAPAAGQYSCGQWVGEVRGWRKRVLAACARPTRRPVLPWCAPATAHAPAMAGCWSCWARWMPRPRSLPAPWNAGRGRACRRAPSGVAPSTPSTTRVVCATSPCVMAAPRPALRPVARGMQCARQAGRTGQ